MTGRLERLEGICLGCIRGRPEDVCLGNITGKLDRL